MTDCISIRETMASLPPASFLYDFFFLIKVLDLWRNHGSGVAGDGVGPEGTGSKQSVPVAKVTSCSPQLPRPVGSL